MTKVKTIIHWNKQEIKIVKNFKPSSIIKHNLLPNRTRASITTLRSRLKLEGEKIYSKKYEPITSNLKEDIRTTNSYKGTVRFYTPEDDKIIMENKNSKAAKLLGRTSSAISFRRNTIKNGNNSYRFVNKDNKKSLLIEKQPRETSISTNDLIFKVNNVEIVIKSNMTKKVLVNKNSIEILTK